MSDQMGWRKSSYSGSTSDCVEVAVGRTVGVRDTKDRDGGTLILSREVWSAVLSALKS
ncbi:DUF397 domain-containing protein [Amycolatopsis anabasis]|uniref:DUF397 domain-containing protein n=1 Tax=Amycolatopsis anabasis TaxID=1840409 RepID=UPI00131B0F84|nr:DUF397 domain-containing protein [Amycolatopsis anabasis]